MRRTLLVVTAVAMLLAHASFSHADTQPTRYKDGAIIAQDTLWSGRVDIDGVVFVPEGVTLTITPGTVVAFKKSAAQYREEGGEGSTLDVLIPGSGIRVEGKVLAVGDNGRPISFTYAGDNPSPGAWGCIFLDHSKGSIFEYCRFEYSTYTIHAHFSQFDVSRCTITNNEDGSRIGYSRVLYDHCDIMDNTGKGLNFYQCRNTVRHCNITGNRDGIFLNEKDAACTIENNNIHDNTGMDLRLGDFHAENVSLKGNWWGTAEASLIARKVWDKEDDPNVGLAVIVPAKAEVIGAGIDGVELIVKWKFKTGGFVDCNPAVDNGIVYFGSWDKKFYAVKADTGELVWSFLTGDCVDSSPAVSEGRVFFGSWDRNLYCLNAKDGKLIWKFEMPPSNFDDHRQASPSVLEKYSSMPGIVFMGGFNGSLYSLEAQTGNKIWEYQTGGPIRCRPAAYNIIWEDSGYLPTVVAGSGDGKIYMFSMDEDGVLQGEPDIYKTGGAVNSSPAINKGAFVGSRDGNLYCLSLKQWEYQTGGRIEYSSPLIVDNLLSSPPRGRGLGEGASGLVLIGDCNGTLQAVNKDTGKLVWKFTGGGGIYSSPQAVKDRVVYGDNAGNVYCLDLKTGNLLGQFRAGDAVQGLSTGPDGTIYAGSRDGYLYALSLNR